MNSVSCVFAYTFRTSDSNNFTASQSFIWFLTSVSTKKSDEDSWWEQMLFLWFGEHSEKNEVCTLMQMAIF